MNNLLTFPSNNKGTILFIIKTLKITFTKAHQSWAALPQVLTALKQTMATFPKATSGKL